MFDLILSEGSCVLPGPEGQLTTKSVDVAINNGKIAEIGEIDPAKAHRVFNAKNFHILPGLIDSQVHFREPGLEHKEDLATGTRSAIAGGVTAVFEMPNTTPATISAIDLKDKLGRAKGRAWCDFAFYLGCTPENADRLDQLESLPGCCGIKIFMGSSTGSLLVETENALDTALSCGKQRVATHCEDEARLKERKHLVQDNPGNVSMHPVWRDEETAFLATQKLLKLAKKYNRPVHVLHVTTKQEMELLKCNKDIASVEVTPQHLTLEAPECYDKLGSRAQMNPPIRTKEHREALWEALANGTVDVIGSDHAPHTLEEKAKTYPQSPSGMPGVQTIVPIMLHHVNEGRLSLEKLVQLMAENPCRLFSIENKGRIEVGRDADFTIVDMNKTHTFSDAEMESKSRWTPYDGMTTTGHPIATIIRGNIVMRDGQIIGSPIGQSLEFDRGSLSDRGQS